MSEDQIQPTVTGIPIGTTADGQPYIGCDAAVALLRGLADVAARIETPEDMRCFAAAVAIEADALDVRAIAHSFRADRT